MIYTIYLKSYKWKICCCTQISTLPNHDNTYKFNLENPEEEGFPTQNSDINQFPTQIKLYLIKTRREIKKQH